MNCRIGIAISILLCIALSGCAARMPERQTLSADAIPQLAEGKARAYVFMGCLYQNHEWGTSEQRIRGWDGNIFLDEQAVSYINNDALLIDIPPGEHTIYWVPYGFDNLNEHKPVPYKFTVKPGDIKYLKANMRDTKKFGPGAAMLGVLGGAVGGAIAGADAAKDTQWIDSIEEEPQQGPKLISAMRIAEYHNL